VRVFPSATRQPRAAPRLIGVGGEVLLRLSMPGAALCAGAAMLLAASLALVPPFDLNLLSDGRVILCANKRVIPPVGWSEDPQ
jgi:hypothetical protein